MVLLNDNRAMEEKIMEFFINYIKNSDKTKLDIIALENIFKDWASKGQVIHDVIFAILKALKYPLIAQ